MRRAEPSDPRRAPRSGGGWTLSGSPRMAVRHSGPKRGNKRGEICIVSTQRPL
jgi:hypothetical protein